jgi:H+-translocating NAD(P) transhydrogenase subunit alpha
MKLVVPRERRPFERRVAASPDTVKKLTAKGLNVVIEAGAGLTASVTDAQYEAAGAKIEKDVKALYKDAAIVLKIQKPLREGEGELDELSLIPKGAVLVATINPYQSPDDIAAYAKAGITAFALELVPRITRAQAMDVLSSQSNLAGYKAVLDAAGEYGRAFPMMMTAAGTIAPARVLIMGAGVAGLQAIATARRLGAIVTASDVRMAAKEQVESLGATFLTVEGMEDMETAGGYAKEAGEDFKKRQAEKVHETLKKTDIAICTALIPGRAAPRLITAAMVADMKPGSVIVDLAVEQGGNCEGSKPGEVVVTPNGVRIVGHNNVPSRLAADASNLFAKNLLNFVGLLVENEAKAVKIDHADEIIKGSLLTQDGAVVHEQFKGAAKAPAAAKPAAAKPAAKKTSAPRKAAAPKTAAPKVEDGTEKKS